MLKTVRKTKRSDTCNIALSFYEKRQTTRLFGLGTATEEVLWEQWILNFKFVQTVNIEGTRYFIYFTELTVSV